MVSYGQSKLHLPAGYSTIPDVGGARHDPRGWGGSRGGVRLGALRIGAVIIVTAYERKVNV